MVCRTDLDAFEDLLTAKPELSERDDVLPFFRDHPNLSALLGSYNPNVTAYDRFLPRPPAPSVPMGEPSLAPPAPSGGA